jgi:hypothetical protein
MHCEHFLGIPEHITAADPSLSQLVVVCTPLNALAHFSGIDDNRQNNVKDSNGNGVEEASQTTPSSSSSSMVDSSSKVSDTSSIFDDDELLSSADFIIITSPSDDDPMPIAGLVLASDESINHN